MTYNRDERSSLARELLSGLTPTAVGCLIILALFTFIALTAPWIAPHGESEILGVVSFAPPDSTYIFGSDYLGRDTFSRLLFGLRVTLSVTVTIVFLCFLFGCSVGFFSAIAGGVVDSVISRIVDGLIAFPSIMLALILITALGPSILVLVVAVAFVNGVQVFRVARALAMDIVVLDYIEAARLRRERFAWIMWWEILPNVLPPLAAEFGIRIAYSTILVSALSFLGLGVQPPHADLGVMIRENMMGLSCGSFAPLYPAFGIAMITVTVNLLIDWYLKETGISLPEEM